MNEPEVIQKVHRFLAREGLQAEPLTRLFTDPHPTLTGIQALKPFQRFAIGKGDLVLHPDLFGLQPDSESLVAIEAKGDRDLLWGITQAEVYLKGVQYSLLAASASKLNEAIVLHARDRGVGVIAVDDGVRLLHLPEARRPLNRIYNALRADLGFASSISDEGTFTYNLPTHYLVWCALLRGKGAVGSGDVAALVDVYPMPSDMKAALRGARKLGLVVVDGATVRLSDVGCAVADLLPRSVVEWATLHRQLVGASGRSTLARQCPEAGAVLRLLLLRDPVVQLVVAGLRDLGPEGGPLVALAQACWRLDRQKAVMLFLKPEAVPSSVDRQGQVDWHSVHASAYRSTTFFQYKSVLRHAGLIVPHALGGSAVRNYDPGNDCWQLIDPSISP